MKKNPHSQEGSNSLVYLFKKIWYYSEGNRASIVWFTLMFIVANAITLLAQPLLWAQIITVVTKEGITTQSMRTLLLLLAALLLVDIIFWSLHGPARILERINAFKARANYRKFLLKGVMSLPMDWHVEHNSGDTIDKVEKGTGALYSFSEDTFEIISAAVQLIGSYCMLVYFSPPSAYIVLAMMLVTMWITMRFDRVMIAQYKRLNHYENNISESVFDAISNITTVVILRVERLVFRAIVHKIDDPLTLFKHSNRLNELKWFLTNICCTITTVIVLGVYFWQHLGAAQGVLAGSVYLLGSYLYKVSQLFFKFTSKYGQILQEKSKVANSEELTNDFVAQNFTNHVLPENWQQLELKGLNFSYHDKKDAGLHLSDISISIRRGERIALIGETGSGKTTLLKIIRDLYHPKSLQLSVDGHDIPNGFEGISQAIALVPQNPEIFATTFLENITLGAEYEMSFIRRFTDMACFTEVVESLPARFNTSIKEKGVNLSGGQQQRLALSRGLLACHNKTIVLLDEPTSSLDVATEMTVYQNIFKEFESKTVISTIHRLNLLPFFDKIYFFDKGQIIGSGTLAELLQSNVKFQKLWNKGHASTRV